MHHLVSRRGDVYHRHCPRFYAGFSPSEGGALSSAERALELKQIQKFLEMKMVRERLKELGLSPDEIQARLNQLSAPSLYAS